MKTKHFIIPILLVIISVSCSNPISEKREKDRILAEMEKEKRAHQAKAAVKKVKKPRVIEASKNELDQKFCSYIMQLPSNKAQKETNQVLDSLDLFFAENPDFDVNCGCSQGTLVKKFGASIPLIKHFFRNKYKAGRNYVFQPLHMASNKGSDTIVNLLLSKGADLNTLDNRKKSVLELGVFSLRPKTVKQLIDQGANPEGICLCGIKDLNRIDELIKAGIDSSGVDVNGGIKPFFEDQNLNAYLKYNPDLSKCPIDIFFASKRSDRTMRKLIKHGWAPFSRASRSGNRYVISELSRSSNMKDETLALMMENIKDTNKVLINEEHDGRYLLHSAIKNDYPKFAAKLLELGADPEIVDDKNLNARDLAKDKPKMEELFN